MKLTKDIWASQIASVSGISVLMFAAIGFRAKQMMYSHFKPRNNILTTLETGIVYFNPAAGIRFVPKPTSSI